MNLETILKEHNRIDKKIKAYLNALKKGKTKDEGMLHIMCTYRSHLYNLMHFIDTKQQLPPANHQSKQTTRLQQNIIHNSLKK